MQNDAFWLAIAVVVLVLCIAASTAIVLGGRRLKRRWFGSAPLAKDKADGSRPTPAWVWIFLIAIMGFVVWANQRNPRRANAVRHAASWTVPLVGGGLCVTFVALFIAYHFIRNYDGALRRAQKLAADGDVDGAIADLRELIENKGPTQTRVNVLGILLLDRKRFNEAAGLFRKAEELGQLKGICRLNLGVALLKGGKPEEAIPVIEDAACRAKCPVVRVLVNLHLAHACADLGDWEAARRHFADAETAAGSLKRTHRDALSKEIEPLRLKLAGAPAAVAKPDQIEEL